MTGSKEPESQDITSSSEVSKSVEIKTPAQLKEI